MLLVAPVGMWATLLRVSRPLDLHHRPLAELSVTQLLSGKHAGPTEPPAHKQIRLFPAIRSSKRPARVVFAAKRLNFRITQVRSVRSKYGFERRRCVSPIVCDPPPQERIDLPSDISHGQLCSMAKPKFPDRRPHGLHRRDAYCGSEPAEQCVVSGVLDQTRPKAVAKKVKLDVRILASAPSVLAVDDLCLCRMHL